MATRKRADGCFATGSLDRHPLHHLFGQAADGGPLQHTVGADFLPIGQHCIFVNAQPGNDPRFFAVFWRIANAAFQHVAVIGARDFLAVDNNFALFIRLQPNNRLQQFTAPCPQQASNAKHFATT